VEMKVLSHEAEALVEPYRREVAAIKRRYFARGLSLYQDFAKGGRARAVNPRVAVLGLFGMMNWIYTWHNPKVDPRADALSEIISNIFLEGVKNGHSHAWHVPAPVLQEPARRRARASGRGRAAPLERAS
jgi:hypothetical protein